MLVLLQISEAFDLVRPSATSGGESQFQYLTAPYITDVLDAFAHYDVDRCHTDVSFPRRRLLQQVRRTPTPLSSVLTLVNVVVVEKVRIALQASESVTEPRMPNGSLRRRVRRTGWRCQYTLRTSTGSPRLHRQARMSLSLTFKER